MVVIYRAPAPAIGNQAVRLPTESTATKSTAPPAPPKYTNIAGEQMIPTSQFNALPKRYQDVLISGGIAAFNKLAKQENDQAMKKWKAELSAYNQAKAESNIPVETAIPKTPPAYTGSRTAAEVDAQAANLLAQFDRLTTEEARREFLVSLDLGLADIPPGSSSAAIELASLGDAYKAQANQAAATGSTGYTQVFWQSVQNLAAGEGITAAEAFKRMTGIDATFAIPEAPATLQSPLTSGDIARLEDAGFDTTGVTSWYDVPVDFGGMKGLTMTNTGVLLNSPEELKAWYAAHPQMTVLSTKPHTAEAAALNTMRTTAPELFNADGSLNIPAAIARGIDPQFIVNSGGGTVDSVNTAITQANADSQSQTLYNQEVARNTIETLRTTAPDLWDANGTFQPDKALAMGIPMQLLIDSGVVSRDQAIQYISDLNTAVSKQQADIAFRQSSTAQALSTMKQTAPDLFDAGGNLILDKALARGIDPQFIVDSGAASFEATSTAVDEYNASVAAHNAEIIRVRGEQDRIAAELAAYLITIPIYGPTITGEPLPPQAGYDVESALLDPAVSRSDLVLLVGEAAVLDAESRNREAAARAIEEARIIAELKPYEIPISGPTTTGEPLPPQYDLGRALTNLKMPRADLVSMFGESTVSNAERDRAMSIAGGIKERRAGGRVSDDMLPVDKTFLDQVAGRGVEIANKRAGKDLTNALTAPPNAVSLIMAGTAEAVAELTPEQRAYYNRQFYLQSVNEYTSVGNALSYAASGSFLPKSAGPESVTSKSFWSDVPRRAGYAAISDVLQGKPITLSDAILTGVMITPVKSVFNTMGRVSKILLPASESETAASRLSNLIAAEKATIKITTGMLRSAVGGNGGKIAAEAYSKVANAELDYLAAKIRLDMLNRTPLLGPKYDIGLRANAITAAEIDLDVARTALNAAGKTYSSRLIGVVGFDSPAAKDALKDAAARLSTSIDDAYAAATKTGSSELVALQERVNSATLSLAEAQTRWPTDPNKWADLLNTKLEAESALAQFSKGGIARQAQEIILMREDLASGRLGYYGSPDWKKANALLAEKESTFVKSLQQLELEAGQKPLSRGGGSAIATVRPGGPTIRGGGSSRPGGGAMTAEAEARQVFSRTGVWPSLEPAIGFSVPIIQVVGPRMTGIVPTYMLASMTADELRNRYGSPVALTALDERGSAVAVSATTPQKALDTMAKLLPSQIAQEILNNQQRGATQGQIQYGIQAQLEAITDTDLREAVRQQLALQIASATQAALKTAATTAARSAILLNAAAQIGAISSTLPAMDPQIAYALSAIPALSPAARIKSKIETLSRVRTGTRSPSKAKGGRELILPPPPLLVQTMGEDKEKRKSFKDSIGWQQGFGIWAAKPPYASPSDFAFFHENGPMPAGLKIVKGGKREAYRSIQAVSGVDVPANLRLNMGIVHIDIASPATTPGKAGAITFTAGADPNADVDLKLSGMDDTLEIDGFGGMPSNRSGVNRVDFQTGQPNRKASRVEFKAKVQKQAGSKRKLKSTRQPSTIAGIVRSRHGMSSRVVR